MFDMPLEQLKTYGGTNPRPADFDEFWQRGLDELNSVDPDVEIIPADFKTGFADCFHLYFTGVRGARLHAKLLQPKGSRGPRPALLQFHGYKSNAGNWVEKLGYAAQGFTVAALDCRGQGGLSEDVGGVIGNTLNGHIIRGLDGPPEDMLFRHVFLDTVQLAHVVMDLHGVDPNEIYAMGNSQGGALTLACAALEPRIRRAAPIHPFLSDYQRVWEIDLDENAYGELRDYFRRFDPLHERQAQIFEQLGYIDVQHLCSRIQARIMMSVGLLDQICPPSTQFAAYNKIKSPKSVLIYPDYAHELVPEHLDAVFKFFTE
jgi:cephalosporin-C deacetylase